jgi:hypothetical protein
MMTMKVKSKYNFSYISVFNLSLHQEQVPECQLAETVAIFPVVLLQGPAQGKQPHRRR